MDLIPVANSEGGIRTLTLSSETQALMAVESTAVERRYVTHEVPMVGKVDYDETRLGYITAWVAGRLDRLFVDFSGVEVREGDHMVSVYSEQLYSAQEELIQALKYARDDARSTTRVGVGDLNLVESAREKLRLLGLKDEQISQIEGRTAPTNHVTIYAPVGGVVIEKLKQQGERVGVGERIYTIADLRQVWVHLDAYESDLPWLRYGQSVVVTTEAYPGEEFEGRIAFIQPVLDDKTRTVKVRVNVPNPDGRLKPQMFVRAVVRPEVAAAGRVIDPSLVGKWISPMHPEIVKEQPGECDICGMALVQAESLGFVAPAANEQGAPLVIPYSAALVTGRRAVVYVELPVMPSGIDAAHQGVRAAADGPDLKPLRGAFAVLSSVLDRPYDQPGTPYAQRLWDDFAVRLAEIALSGERVSSRPEAAELVGRLDSEMANAHEAFGPLGQPTFEGREIVLGPRAGSHYLVRHGLAEGELVVTQGNFKIDAEIQIQAKPSMMTPEGGGGGGGHNHGGAGSGTKGGGAHAGHTTKKSALPIDFVEQIRTLSEAYERVVAATREQAPATVASAFRDFGQVLARVDGSALAGPPRAQWRELEMLLGNDAVEGSGVVQTDDADRVFLLLKRHMRRLRDELGIAPEERRHVARLSAPEQFQTQLALVWEGYLAVQAALAGDEPDGAEQALARFTTALERVNGSPLSVEAHRVWETEASRLSQASLEFSRAQDLGQQRSAFKRLSEAVGVVAKSFGFGSSKPVYELHCPMAFQGQGAVWYQGDDRVTNPYFGAAMIKCADRVEKVLPSQPMMPDAHDAHQGHSGH